MVALEGSGLYRLHWASGSGFGVQGLKRSGLRRLYMRFESLYGDAWL